MNRIIFFILAFSYTIASQAKGLLDISYPDSLAEDADAIVLYEKIEFHRNSESSLTETYSKAITIRNKQADYLNTVSTYYDNSSDIKEISCSTYDSNGKLIKKFKDKEILDFSHYASFTLYSDNRVKAIQALNQSYPYTIVFNYKKEYDGFFILPNWQPFASYRVAVKEASLTTSSPKDWPFTDKVFNPQQQLEIDTSNLDGRFKKTYTGKAFKAIKKEKFAPSIEQQTANVFFAPINFKYAGYRGSNKSWKDLGLFSYSLFHDKNELTDKTKADLDQLKAKANSEKELTKFVYEYMQNKTRYVGIQLGIGGWQPFPSIDVDEKGYGDCKALSYYTMTLLDYVGIKSIFTIIGSGSSSKIYFDDFPANQTNHAILCVPFHSDTTWLECTSQIAPYNYLSNNNTNRKALLVTQEGGKLTYIPQEKDNTSYQFSKIDVHPNGDIQCHNNITYTGSFFDNHYYLHQKSSKELTDYLEKNIRVKNIKVESCSTSINDKDKAFILQHTFSSSNTATLAGDRIFLDLTPFSNIKSRKKQKTERRCKVIVNNKQTYTDSIRITIPHGYTIEFKPPNCLENSEFGTYSLDLRQDNNELIIKKVFTKKEVNLPKERYDDFIDYINKVSRLENYKVVLKKHEV